MRTQTWRVLARFLIRQCRHANRHLGYVQNLIYIDVIYFACACVKIE